MLRSALSGALATLFMVTVSSTTAMADCRDEISAVENILSNATRVREKRQAAVERLLGRARTLYEEGKIVGCRRVAGRAKEVLLSAPSLKRGVKPSVSEVEAAVPHYKIDRQLGSGNSVVINFHPDKTARAEIDLGPRGMVYREGKWWVNADSSFCYEMEGIWGRSEKSENCLSSEKKDDRVVFRRISD